MGTPKELASFFDIFDQLDDPRVERTRLYPMGEILLVTLCGVAAGCDGWSDIELFAQQRLSFLRRYQAFKHGVPSDDTLRRFFRAVDPEQFQTLFIQWMHEVVGADQVRHIAIDGKTARGSADGAQNALHLVSAYASETHLVLGQQAVDTKSNEITAIPMLLEALDLRGSTITIDAMGCQHKIAHQIVNGGGHYVFGLKGNQGTLHEDVVTWFDRPPKTAHFSVFGDNDKGHGRVETRKITVGTDVAWLHQRHPKWQTIQSMVKIESERWVGGKAHTETRYYITSRKGEAEQLLSYVRRHWGIENELHWVLDMSFGEDQSRIRKGNAPGNIAVVRHVVLNAINAVKPKRASIKQMRKLAGWSDDTLAKILSTFI